MAVLQKIRNKPKLLIGIIAIALLAFIFPWNQVTSFINRQKNRAFSAGGENVSIEAHVDRVSSFIALQKEINPNMSLDDDATAQVRQYVYQQMLNETILNVEGEKTGLSVSEDEIQDLVFGKNISPVLSQIPFFVDPRTRQANPDAINQFVAMANTDINSVPKEQKGQLEHIKSLWSNIQNMIKYDRLQQKYNALLANTILINNIEIEANKGATASTANIAYVINRYSAVPDSTVNVTKKEIEKLYNDRKNSFRTDENTREISYITKQVVPSEEDNKQAFDEVNMAKERLTSNDNTALVMGDYPQIPFNEIYYSLKELPASVAEFAQTATIGQVNDPIREITSYNLYKLVDRKLGSDSVKFNALPIPANINADSIISVIKGGKSFQAVVTEINPQLAGPAEWATEAQLGQQQGVNPTTIEQIFNTPVGSISKLDLGAGSILINVEEKTQPINKYLVAIVQIPITISDKTYGAVDNELAQFISTVKADNFVKTAQEKGYNVTPKVNITDSQINIEQIPGSRQVIFWAFNDKVGAIKKFDVSDYRVIAMIDAKPNKGYLPLSAVEETLKEELINNKKAENMIAEMKAKNLTTLNAYAQSIPLAKVDTANYVTFETPNIMGIGYEPVLNVYSEVGEINKLSQPIKGTNGVLVVDVLSRANDSKEFNAEQYKQTVNSQNYYLVMTQAMNALKEKMNVKNNIISFY